MPGYLPQLTVRLSRGLEQLTAESRQRHTDYLLQQQRADGGFGGREGDSDLYYTSFALRSLAILGELDGTPAHRAAVFLRARLAGQESIVDFLSLVYSASLIEASAGVDVFADTRTDWRQAVSDWLERLRRDDGGYAKGLEGAASSTYHTFLVLLCRELIELPPPHPDRIVSFLKSQWTEPGGFLEIRASKRAGTNPTAAATIALRLLDRLDAPTRDDVVDFLLDMQTEEGGFRANTRIPFADLLSTFTALATLSDLDALGEIDARQTGRFVASLQLPNGGFQAIALDPGHDVEYTFYGLGSLALLSGAASAR